MPRLLKLAHCEVDVLSTSHALVAQRRFVDKRYLIDDGVAAITTKLLSLVESDTREYDWVIIGDDALFEAVAARGNARIDRWFPSKRDPRSIEFFTSKIAFMQRCRENGFSIAPFELCDSLAAAQTVAREYGFPVVIKTAHSVGGSGVTRVDNGNELEEHLKTITGQFAVQKFAQGRQIIAEVLFDRGRARCWITSELHNRWPRRLGPCTVRELIDVPQMHDTLESIGKLTNFHGFASVDCILPHEGGPPMLSEMNPRTTTGYHFDSRVRAEFAKAVSEMLDGKPFKRYTPLPAPGSKAALFPEAFYYLTARPQELSRWRYALNSLQRVPVDDPLYLVQMAKDYRHFLHGEIKKKFAKTL